jgi:hypothetical protein
MKKKSAEFRVTMQLCPHCGYEMDGLAPLKGETRPVAGDVSICLKCSAALRFTDDLKLVLEDRPEVLSDSEILKVQEAAREIIERANKGWRPLICCCCEGRLPEEVSKVEGGLKPGTRIICAYCANVIVLMKDGSFIPETNEEFLANRETIRMRKLVQESIDRRKAHTN